MVSKDGPIYYKDLISPDNSVSDLIKQLEDLKGSYSDLMKHIKSEAAALTASLNTVSGATIEGQRATKEAAVNADRLSKEYQKLSVSESEVAFEIEKVRKATTEANRIAKIEARLATEKEGSYNHLSAQYSLLKIKINALSTAERENTEEGRNMVKTSRDIYAEMNRLQQETGKFSLNVGNYTDSIREAIGSFGNSLNDIVQSRKTFGEAVKDVGSNLKTLGATIAGLMANPAFWAVLAGAGVAAGFRFWYNYNKEIREATKLTQQFTGLAGNDLKAYRNEVQATADLFNKDFKEVLISANAVAKQFGISQQEALKGIQDGFIAGADVRGEFLEDLKEYPAYFREAGLTAREFIAISTQQAKDGIFSDKGVDTIKEGNIRLREMTKATREALDGIGLSSKKIAADLQSGQTTTFKVIQEVSAKLSELPPQSAAVGTAIADIFGGPGEDAGLRYLTTLKDIDTNLDNVKGKAGELGRIQEEQLQAQIELSNVIAGLFDATGGTFETMTANAKLFVTRGLTSMIKGVIELANKWIDLYNEAVAFRVVVQSFVSVWDLIRRTGITLFNFLGDSFSSLGTIIEGLFKFDGDIIASGLTDLKLSVRRGIVDMVGNVIDTVNAGVERGKKKIKPINIPITTGGDGDTTPTPLGGSGTPPPAKDPAAEKAAEDARKKAEEIRKKTLELTRRGQDELLKLEEDQFKKREQAARYSYARQIEDLKYELKTNKDLTKEGKQAINNIITSLENQLTKELADIEQERSIFLLEEQKKGLELRLQSVREGTKEELDVRTQLLEIEKSIAQAKNEAAPAGQKQDGSLINAGIDAQITALNDKYLQERMRIFEQQQDLAQSEFDLLVTSEDEKTRFRIKAEIERWKEILRINKEMGNQLSDVEIKTIENHIKKAEKDLKKGKRYNSLLDLMGLNLEDDQKEAISETTQFAIEQISAILDAKVKAAEQAVSAANAEVDASQRRLDAEIEARNNGYANNVATAQKELDMAKKNQAAAEKQKAQAVKRQQMLDTISQTSSLITASANIWSSLSGIPVVGTALALAALALMWGSFAASKAKASQVAGSESYGDGTVELLKGGSHASGNDIDLGSKPDGTRRRAEGGEFFAVVNKRSSQKYRKIFPNLIKSINNGTFHEKYMGAFSTERAAPVITLSNDTDMRKLEGDVRKIKEQGERKVYSIDGKVIEIYRNRKRVILN